MQKTAAEALYEKRISKIPEKFKDSATIKTVISRYGKRSTESTYLSRIESYATWLQNEKGIAR